mgnify:CR=1 FL=1
MFTNEIAIYGDYGVMADRLKEIGLFERILDQLRFLQDN